MRDKVKDYNQLPLLILLMAFLTTACDYPQEATDVNQRNSGQPVDSIEEIEKNQEDNLASQDLAQQVMTLQAQVTQLEDELEQNRGLSVSAAEAVEKKQWKITQLKEKMVALEEDNQALKGQLEGHISEIAVLQEALKKTDVNCDLEKIKE